MMMECSANCETVKETKFLKLPNKDLGHSIWVRPHINCYKANFSFVGKLNLCILTEKKSSS